MLSCGRPCMIWRLVTEGVQGVADDDATLVLRAQTGDGAAFTALFQRYVDAVYDFAWRVLRQPSAADSVVRDTFIRAARSLPGLTTPGSFPTWLLAIAYHLAIERLPQVGPPTEPPNELDPARTADPEVLGAGPALAALVWEGAAGLDRRHYALLHLTTRNGFAAADLASVLSVPVRKAQEMVDRVQRAVDDAITAYVIARRERDGCPSLAAIVPAGPIRVFDPQLRQRVSEHIRQDPHCLQAAQELPPPRRVLAALDVLPAPATLRSGLAGHLQEMLSDEAAAAGADVPPTGHEPEGDGWEEPGLSTEPTLHAEPAPAPDRPETAIASAGPQSPLPWARESRGGGIPPRPPREREGQAAGGGFWGMLRTNWTILGAAAIFLTGVAVMGTALVKAWSGGNGGATVATATAAPASTATVTATHTPSPTETPAPTPTTRPPTATAVPVAPAEPPPPPAETPEEIEPTATVTQSPQPPTATPVPTQPPPTLTATPPPTEPPPTATLEATPPSDTPTPEPAPGTKVPTPTP